MEKSRKSSILSCFRMKHPLSRHGLFKRYLIEIQELNQLSDHGYPGLFEAFERIQEALQVLLSPPSPEHSGPLIRPVEDLSKDDAEKAGRKMAVLGEIKNRLYPQVPDGFVMTVRADQVFTAHNRLDPEINRIFQSCDPEDFSQLLEASGGRGGRHRRHGRPDGHDHGISGKSPSL